MLCRPCKQASPKRDTYLSSAGRPVQVLKEEARARGRQGGVEGKCFHNIPDPGRVRLMFTQFIFNFRTLTGDATGAAYYVQDKTDLRHPD